MPGSIRGGEAFSGHAVPTPPHPGRAGRRGDAAVPREMAGFQEDRPCWQIPRARGRIGKAFANTAGAAMPAPPPPPDLYSLRDIAAAAGVSDAVVLELAARGNLVTLTSLDDASPLMTGLTEEDLEAVLGG